MNEAKKKRALSSSSQDTRRELAKQFLDEKNINFRNPWTTILRRVKQG